jgi:hypothetical protein
VSEQLRARLHAPNYIEHLSRLIAADDEVENRFPTEPVKRQRRPSLAARIKQVERAGLTVKAIKPDGTLITSGEPTLTATGDNDDDMPDRSDWH